MKKFLLVVAAAIIAVSASAQVRPSLKMNKATIESKLNAQLISHETFSGVANVLAKQAGQPVSVQPASKAPRKDVTPAGTPEYYTCDGYFYTYFGMYYITGMADQLSFDGNDVYFKSLFPYDYTELWTKGTVNEAGDEVTIPMDVVGMYYDTYDLVPCELVLDEEGYVADQKPIVLKKDGNRIYAEDDVDNPSRYFALAGYLDGEYAGLLTYELCLDFQKLEGDYSVVEVPESAEVMEYTYAYTDAYGASQAALGNVAVDGNDVYFDNLTLGLGWVKGTRDGNTVTIPSGQFLGGDAGYYLFFDNCQNFGQDEDYNTTYDVVDNYTLTVSTTADGDVYTQAAEEDTPTLLTSDGTVYNYNYNYVIEPFAGLNPAVPSDPKDLYILDYTSYYDQYVLCGSTPNVDVNGKYMAPENMEVSIWEDGDMLTFTADDGYYLSEDVDWMPYGWTDDEGGYDLGYVSLSPYFYLYESLFTELGMQVRYTVDGVTNYSNVVYVDIDGNERTEEVNPETGVATGINSISNAKQSNAIYNLAGQRVSNNFKGIAIKNGKKMLMK